MVEDDAVIAGAVQRHLESWGYRVACAERFDDVLSEFATFDPSWYCWISPCPFSAATTGAGKFERSKVPVLFLTSRPGQGTLVRLDLSRERRIVE